MSHRTTYADVFLCAALGEEKYDEWKRKEKEMDQTESVANRSTEKSGDDLSNLVLTTCPECDGEGVIDDWQCSCGDDTCCCLEPEPTECRRCGGFGSIAVKRRNVDRTDEPERSDSA